VSSESSGNVQELRRIGPWALGAKLGTGGNAVVWEATRMDLATSVALKVINATKADQEPYRRFVQEVEFLRSTVDEPGVLQLLEAHLPNKPSSSDRPWLAMPIATPIAAALEDEPLETVVKAIGAIATTLSRLAVRGVGHRDIKPGNLYRFEGRWLVGDFGLVAAPDMDELTRSGKALGPAHFTAYEMIRDPVNADPLPADVYSLGKTLWVLATKQRWPPEGHQPAATRGYSIAALRPHAHADALDRLVDLATRLHPDERPSMADVARDLAVWADLGLGPGELDVSDISAQFRNKVERELAAEDLLEQRRQLAHQAARKIQESIRPLNDALRQVHPRPELNGIPDRSAQSMLRTLRHSGSPNIVFEFGRISRIKAGREPIPLELTLGVGIELTDGGHLIFRSFIHVGYRKLSGPHFHWSSEAEQATVGSIEAGLMIERGVAQLGAKLRDGLQAFVANLPTPAPH
jgi:serine/threonine protein kinase